MAGINPVTPAQVRTKRVGGKSKDPLQKIGAVIGGIGGGIAGAAAGGLAAGPAGVLGGAVKGSAFGAASGAGLGGVISSLVDPVRDKSFQASGPQSGGQFSPSTLAQKYRMSEMGRSALSGYEVAQRNPQYAEFQQPLAMAIMQDIARNNGRQA